MSQGKINAEHSGSKATPNHPRDIAELGRTRGGQFNASRAWRSRQKFNDLRMARLRHDHQVPRR